MPRAASLCLLIVNALIVFAVDAHPQLVADDPGVSGYVLAPDGTPASGGTAIAQSGFASTSAPIDRTGRFRFVPTRPGLYDVIVNAPGFAPYRARVTVPPSRSMCLPVIRLVFGTYYRVKLVTPAGEPIFAPQLRRRVFDVLGRPMLDALGDRVSDALDDEGATTIGPLPRGIMTVAVNMPLFAQTRLPDVNVTDTKKTVDGGTIVIQQPGAVLNVDVTDGSGAPVRDHDVHVEDARPRSPLAFEPVRTNQQGRATFERLAAGRYRVWTTATERCANDALVASRVVPVPDNGTVETPLVAGGRATFRISSPLGPATAVLISAAPTVPQTPSPLPFRPGFFGCRGTTDGAGRVTLTNFPPGPAHVEVHMANSTYVRQVEVPFDGRELGIAVPEGLLPVRVVNDKNEPLAGAAITWTSGGGRVEATATVTGDALLDGVGLGRGTLTVSARGYQVGEEQLAEPPGILHLVALSPLPRPVYVRAQVTTMTGEPLSNAVVELISANPAAVPRIAATDTKGLVTFGDVLPGSLQLFAAADGFVASTLRVATAASGAVPFPLPRGYRINVTVELPASAGSQLVRVLNDAGASMDDVLDGGSDRGFEPPGRLSLGPLIPRPYVVELQGAAGRLQQRIRIVDRDVSTTFR